MNFRKKCRYIYSLFIYFINFNFYNRANRLVKSIKIDLISGKTKRVLAKF